MLDILSDLLTVFFEFLISVFKLAWRHKFITLIIIVFIVFVMLSRSGGSVAGKNKSGWFIGGKSIFSIFDGSIQTFEGGTSTFEIEKLAVDDPACQTNDRSNCFIFLFDHNYEGLQFTPLEIDNSAAAALIKSEGINSGTIEFLTMALDGSLGTRGSAQRSISDRSHITIFYACNLETKDGAFYEKQDGLPEGYFHNDPKKICDFVLLHELGHAVDLLKGGQDGGSCGPQDRCETMDEREKDASTLAKKWFDNGARLIIFQN